MPAQTHGSKKWTSTKQTAEVKEICFPAAGIGGMPRMEL